MKVKTLDEGIIQDIGHAFGYYDYGEEKGLVSAYSSREAAAAFICGYVRMALRSGMLHTTGERGEGYIAYKLPQQKIGLKAGMELARALLGSMTLGELIRYSGIMSKQDTADLIFTDILYHTLHAIIEYYDFTIHCMVNTVYSSNSITDPYYITSLTACFVPIEILNLTLDNGDNICCTNCAHRGHLPVNFLSS